MENIDGQMVTLKEQGAAARGYKGQLTMVTKRLERSKEQLDTSSFQEAQACYDNLNIQFDNFNKALHKLKNCIADMSVTIELGFSLANNIDKGDTRNEYLDKLGKLRGNIDKSEEENESSSVNMEKIQKHAIEVMELREEEKEKAQEVKFKANENLKKEMMDRADPERDRDRERRNPPHEDKKRDFKDCVGLRQPAISIDSSPEDFEMWASNARLYANASNMEVLKGDDQKVLLCNILERDLYLSLQLEDGDGLLAGVDKVIGVYDGLCNLFMRRVGFMKERKQPGETNWALCRRLGYLGNLANIKEVSGNDQLMMRFTALCYDKALRWDIFKIKDLSWNSLQEAVNTHKAASRMDTVTLTRDKLFNLNVSNTRNSTSSSPLQQELPVAVPLPTLLPR